MRQQASTGSNFACLTILVGSALLCGCAAQPAKVTGTWTGSAPRNQPFTKVLVVAVGPEVNQRCAFERFMASRLTTEATKGIASCGVVADKHQLTRESIEAAVAAQQADAVLATSLVSKAWDVEEGGSRDTRGSAGYKATDAGYATGYYGVYGVPVVYGEFRANAAAITMQGEVQVTSKVFETKGATVVYTLDTKVSKIESTDAGLAAITDAIAEKLRKEGITR